MRSFDTDALATLDAGRASTRTLLRFDLGSGSYGFWDGFGPLVHDGITYVGAGRFISAEVSAGTLSSASPPIVVRLNSMPNSEVTPDVLATIFQEEWHQKPAVISRAYFDPDTKVLISVERIARRVIDRIEWEETVGGEAVLVGYLELVQYDNAQRGFLRFGDADQRLIDATDGFFSFAATAGSQTIEWGRKPDTAPGASGPGGGGGENG